MKRLLVPLLPLTLLPVVLSSCDGKPPASSNTSEFREGKSGATSATIQDDKTDEPTPYPASEKEKPSD